ncbi:hypothetical protein LINGRAHAP2_LOCUS15505 [Linum grandiflorum]
MDGRLSFIENKPNNTKESNGCTGKTKETSFTPFHLRVVPANESGKGFPYAPENWPSPRDMWGWKVGKRLTFSGYHIDRNLYLPKILHHLPCISNRVKNGFESKLSVRMLIEKHFPNADIKAFFASFVWNVPSKHASMNRLMNKGASPTIIRDLDTSPFHVVPSVTLGQPVDLQSNNRRCKKENKVCISLEGATEIEPLPAVPCDICCDESDFSRDCCCIVCCKTVSSSHGGYSYVRCHTIVTEGCFCSHVTHLECALRTYMAGAVGGCIGLDAEYFCQRCDAKIHLVPHAVKLLQTCKSMDCRDEIQKM